MKRSDDVVSQMRDIYSLEPILRAKSLVEKLKATVKQLEGALVDARDVPGDIQPAASVEADAQALLESGGDLSVLDAQPSPERGRQLLLRQYHAARKAVAVAEHRLGQIVTETRRAELERLRPGLQAEYGSVLDALAGVDARLSRWSDVVDEVGRHGLSSAFGSVWALTPFERGLLDTHSGQNLHQHIQIRRRGVGLDAEGSK